MFKREERSGALPCRMDGAALYIAVRPCEVDVFKHAERMFFLSAVFSSGGYLAVFGDDDLARLDIPDVMRAHGVESAGLRSECNSAAGEFTHAERTEAVGIPRSDELGRGHDDERIRSLDTLHSLGYRFLDGGCIEAFLYYRVGYDLRIGGGVEYRALKLQLLSELRIVGQISVVRKHQASLDVVNDQGLAVDAPVVSGCGVAYMPHRHASRAERGERAFVEHIVHQALVTMSGDNAVIVDGYACALLPPVLESVERIICVCGNIVVILERKPDNAAFFMN